MGNRDTTEDLQPIKDAVTNSTRGSIVTVEAEHPPMLFFRPETGELIAVPVTDANALNTEIGEWNSLIATLLDANEQVQYFEDALLEYVLKPDLGTPAARESAEKNLETAVAWQEKITDACRTKIEPLSKIGSAGKQLVELIPVPTDKPKESKNKPGEFKDGKYEREWSKKSPTIGTKKLPVKDWIRPPAGSLVYVPSDKIKAHWPKLKDPETIKWTDAIGKRPGGVPKIDTDKAQKYAKQLKKNLKLQSKDYLKLEGELEGVLADWATAWNEKLKTSGEIPSKGGAVDHSIEYDAGAQLMRYLCGGSLNATFEPFKKNVAFRVEGRAEIAFAEAKASAALYFPGKDGWMWTLPAVLVTRKADAKDLDLGAVRCAVSLEAKGVVGASIAGECSLGIETKEGQMPTVRGIRTPVAGKRRTRKVPVVRYGPEETMHVAGLDVGLNAFAGAKADGEIKGAIEWRNPENKKKTFEAFASLAPSVGGLAGLGGTAKLTIQYVNGIFKVHADAALCIGLGAEGKLTFEVSTKLLLSFIKWFFYQLYGANFNRLPFITPSAFETAKNILFIAIATGKDVLSSFGLSQSEIKIRVAQIFAALEQPGARQRLASHILSEPELLRYAPPETKSMLVYQLTDNQLAAAPAIPAMDDTALRDQRLAVSYLLGRWSHTQSDLNNVIQHISAEGDRGDYHANLASLRSFFGDTMPRDANLAGILKLEGQDFDEWHERLLANLKDEPTRGFPVVPSDSFEYAMQRDDGRDHPLFASSGTYAYYA